jgi:hypothetical protein
MKKMKNKILLFVFAILLVSCSSPLDKPFKKDNLEEDIIELKKSLSEDELQMLAGFIALKSLGDDKMLGKTYGDLLDEAKKLREELKKQEEEEKILAEKAKIDEVERIKRLGGALTVSLFDKGFSEYNYQEYISYKFAFENKTDKDIKAFTGRIIFNDLFDKEISSLNLTYDDGIPANSTKNWNAQTDFNQFMDKDVALKNKDVEDLKVKWIPEKIIFSDNSTLE